MINQLAIAALLAAQTGAAGEPCLTREEVGDIAVTLTSHIVEAVADKCRPHLDSASFINAGSDTYFAKLKMAAAERQASALRAFTRISGVEGGGDGMGEVAMAMLTGMLAGGMGAAVKPETCPDVDRMLGALAPLPPENLGIFVGSGFAMAAKVDENDENDENTQQPAKNEEGEETEERNKLTICPE